MFFGRSDIFHFIESNLSGAYQDNILILHGQRRTGKSSILWQLERRDLLPGYHAVLVDLQGFGRFDTAGFFHSLARLIVRRLSRNPDYSWLAVPERSEFRDTDPYSVFLGLLDDVEEALEATEHKLLVMFDEFEVLEMAVEAGRLDGEIFGFVRSLMQSRERISFVLTGTHKLMDMREDYWSILFSLASYRKVSFLEPDEARELIERPTEGLIHFDDLAKETILHLTAGHPYYIQVICQHLVSHLNDQAEHNYVTRNDIRAVAAEVLTASGAHFEYEWKAATDQAVRDVMRAIAALDETGLRFASITDVEAHLERQGWEGDGRALTRAVAGLVERDVLIANTDNTAFRYRVDLMRQWARRNRVATELRGGVS
jgi:type I restriction enzyme M protein